MRTAEQYRTRVNRRSGRRRKTFNFIPALKHICLCPDSAPCINSSIFFSTFLVFCNVFKSFEQSKTFVSTSNIPIKENQPRNRYNVITCCIPSLSILELQLQIIQQADKSRISKYRTCEHAKSTENSRCANGIHKCSARRF